MPGTYPSPRPTAPRERGKSRKNDKNYKKAMGHGHNQSGTIKSHALQIALKGTKHLFLFPFWFNQTPRQQKPSLPSPRDYYQLEKRPLSPEYWDIADVKHSQMPLDEPAKKEEVSHENREGFRHTELCERLTGANQTVPATNPRKRDDQEGVLKYDFIYDILLFTFDKQLRRRMIVDFKTEANFMDHDVFERMNVRMDPYDGPPTQLTTRGELTPLGKVQATWIIVGYETPYCAEFYVVKGTSFDVILGTTSCRAIDLSSVDPMIATRLDNLKQT
ncbi:hypothetical protein AtubIFM55763_004939 [Aspergillus tubingensis]|uniref:Uncharacterized protein n=1 Tax=Aspergillus tubingensis TaxID=5068 RepID=A0A9W6ANL4_ASPTU|nr:hypothetical protein AtubIFM55763_004939 [Aspergillus tubingensis]GLA84833.1 hypothetical protein AtubIFM56815_009051 [Aspergillus tubingensis]